MTDIFREVEEDLRRERLNKVWKRYGGLLLGLAALIVIGTGGWRYYEYRQAAQSAAAGEQFGRALTLSAEDKHAEAAEALAALAASSEGGYPALARIRAAGERAAAGDVAAAVTAFDAIAADGSVPASLRALARVRAAALVVDTGSREEVARRVEALAGAGSPWRHSARELIGLAAWKAGEVAEAERWLAQASADPEAPQGVKSRAEVLLTLIAGASRPPAAPGAASGTAAGATN